MKVLVTESISQQGLSRLRQELKVEIRRDLSRKAFLACIGDYDGIIVRGNTRLDNEILERATNLKVIGRAGSGVDNIDVETATRKGILLVHAPESNTISAAEHTIALLLSQLRNIPKATTLLRNGKWRKERLRGIEAYGKCLGIIGLGRLDPWWPGWLKVWECGSSRMIHTYPLTGSNGLEPSEQNLSTNCAGKLTSSRSILRRTRRHMGWSAMRSSN